MAIADAMPGENSLAKGSLQIAGQTGKMLLQGV
jgi:hypothetical protein